MPVPVISPVDEQIFLLNVIELLAALFRTPDSAGWAAIRDTGLPALAARAPIRTGQLTDTLEKLQGALDSSENTIGIIDELLSEQVRLFVAGRGGVVAPPYESCHRPGESGVMGEAALSMRSRLAEAGLEVALPSNEPPDHLSLELEYLHHLLSTAWAEQDGTREAEALAFSGETMLPWVARFRDALLEGTPHPVFTHAADLAVALLEELSSRADK
ncbi:TorD/DmsD family molecular chaperone [Pseudodesulfovibrio cashew]|uniref:TorD/DmsD family molecular chaperone n=1 Tax=Pseudodesulfovibrio cashew TaxID=2678688 RepID=UPI00131DEB0E|nr:molecular chaperone TorD family protein [Pseudodesulfovibrio cashew]